MSVDISVSITEDVVDIIATPTVNIVNVTNSASIDPGLYDLSEFTNTSPNPFVRASGLSSYVPTSRTITINGLTQDLSINRSWTIPATTWGTITGTLSAQTDLQTALNAKQNTLSLTTTGSSGASTLVGATLNVPNYTLSGLGGVPTSRTLTINGVTQDLSADRTFTISTGITIGSTAIASGTVGRILFEGAGNVVQESSSLFWDNTNNRLGIGTSSPNVPLEVVGSNLLGIRTQISVNNAFDSIQVRNSSTGDTNQVRIKFDNENTVSSSSGGVIFYTGNNYAFFPQNSFGFWNHTSNGVIALATNNTERFRIFSTGNVAINTTTDAGFRLDVNGTARTQQLHTFSQGTYLDANTSNNYHRVYTGASTYGGLQLQNEIVNYTGYITTGRSGNQLGINFFHTTYAGGVSASSHQKFTQGGVQFGSFSVPNTLTVFNVGGGNGTVNYPIVANNQLNTTNTGVGYLFQTGDSTGSGPINHAAISAWKTNGAAPSVTSSLRFYTINDAANSLTEKMRIADSGNILINTTTDAGFRLDVNGTARIDQTLQLNGTGTATLIAMGGNIGRFTIDGLFIRFKVTGGGDILNMTTNFFGVNETSVIPSAICAMTSTNRGFLPPRMTTTQKNAIASPAAGLVVYDTTLNKLCVYTTAWETVTSL